jgi:hypothetical protein
MRFEGAILGRTGSSPLQNRAFDGLLSHRLAEVREQRGFVLVCRRRLSRAGLRRSFGLFLILFYLLFVLCHRTDSPGSDRAVDGLSKCARGKTGFLSCVGRGQRDVTSVFRLLMALFPCRDQHSIPHYRSRSRRLPDGHDDAKSTVTLRPSRNSPCSNEEPFVTLNPQVALVSADKEVTHGRGQFGTRGCGEGC